MTRICVAGATGWTGRAIAKAVIDEPDLELVGAIARKTAGQDIGEVLGVGTFGVTIVATVDEALRSACDVLVDYTSHTAVRSHVDLSIARSVACVIGSSGLTEADYSEIQLAARDRGVGVIASGNFSVMVAILQHSALLAARHLDSFEVIDYASAEKSDVPSGTARELAERLAAVRSPRQVTPPRAVAGPVEARGATVSGVQIHSVRLPSYSVSTEVIFGAPDERLHLRHEAGSGAGPYVAGTLLAIRKVTHRVGLTRGLDRLLFEE
jgi:4-hydroxy-tetrahydrodipicolinate reductase